MTDATEGTADESEPAEALVQEATDLVGTEGLWRGQILHTGAELGLFEVLDDAPVSASDLAVELGLDTENTYRLLRAMAHFGVLDEDEDRRFSLTPIGELFQADHPHSVRSDLLFNRSQEWMRAMLHLPEIVREGELTGFEREFGCGFFDYVLEHPEFGERYNALIELASRNQLTHVLDALAACDFSQLSHVCDVGGGRGHLLCHFLKAHPHLRGTVLDLPSVVSGADRLWASELGVSDRCTYVSGDMFEDVPEADAYFLKWILHNFDDEECQRILSNVHDAAPPDGRLFVIETLVPGPDAAHFAKRRDITMMVQLGGRERTPEEYASLLERAEWELVETWDADEGPLSVLEAQKA